MLQLGCLLCFYFLWRLVLTRSPIGIPTKIAGLLKQLTSIVKPTSVVKPSNAAKLNSVMKPSNAVKPSNVVKPSNAAKLNSVVKPSNAAKLNSVMKQRLQLNTIVGITITHPKLILF